MERIFSSKRKIILVDDMVVNLMVGRNALSGRYDVFTVPSAEKLFKLIPIVSPDLILLDVEMPEMSGFEAIIDLKNNPETAHIPVVFLTARNDAESEIKGLSLGAVDYISKPFSQPLLIQRIEVHLLIEDQKKTLANYNNNLEKMVSEKTKTIFELQNSILGTMAELVEYRDDVTGSHIERTQKYLEILLDKLLESSLYSEEVSGWDTNLLLNSAQLHDVGKIAISDRILHKPGKLTAEEFEEMKKHTTFGGKVIEKIKLQTTEHEFLDYAEVLAIYHHEKWNGKGYPFGLSKTDIPLPARLMSIVDVYDALSSVRPYKSAFSHRAAISIISDERGKHFDPVLVDLFLEVEDKIDVARNLISSEISSEDEVV